MRSPCVNCPKMGCGVYHDECEAYQAFVKKREAEREAKLQSGDYRSYKTETIARETRRAN